MKLLGKHLLQPFKNSHADSRGQIDSWEAEVGKAQWASPYDVKNKYPKASIIGGGHVVFNISGDRYRIWVQISYKNSIVLIKKIGTHKEYNNWNIG